MGGPFARTTLIRKISTGIAPASSDLSAFIAHTNAASSFSALAC